MSFYAIPLNSADIGEIRRIRDSMGWVTLRPGVGRKDFEYKGHKYMFSSFSCQDCGVDWPENYSVTNELWASLGLTGMICLKCLEKRMGRKLVRTDFVDCPVNMSILNFLKE